MTGVFENCQYGDHFNARTDKIERYGPDVMGCKRPKWEGYTKHGSTCEPLHATNVTKPSFICFKS